MLVPSQALAIAGVDDAVVGALLLAMMGLAGYTVATTLTSTSLANMGYSFSQFAADVNNQQAAVTRALADANNLGVQVNRQNAEDAAAAIAAGTGAFGDWLADVAATGRATIDGWLGGSGANQAALWGLVTEWRSAILGELETPGLDSVMASNGARLYNYFATVRLAGLSDFETTLGITMPAGVTWVWCARSVWQNPSSGVGGLQCFCGTDDYKPTIRWYDQSRGQIIFSPASYYQLRVQSGSLYWYALTAQSFVYNESSSYYPGYPIITPNVITGSVLPGVDKAPDCPETLGAGYDITPVGADAVIGQDGTITNSGSIAVPIGVTLPGVDVPYSQGLYGLDAGVVSGLRTLPYSAELTDAWVGTPEGVVSMPISQAIASSTSIGATAVPSVPVVPPGTPDVGPWQPAYSLPFYDVWPFNLVYTFVKEISALGGS